jgi:hypothetical protein
MPTNIIDIGQWRLTRRDRFTVASRDECAHRHLLLQDRGELVVCEDCKAQLSAYWALSSLASDIAKEQALNAAGRQRIQEERQSLLPTSAAKRLESLWQTGRLVPACPHCKSGILAEDGLGSRTVTRSSELRRRKGTSSSGADEDPPPT